MFGLLSTFVALVAVQVPFVLGSSLRQPGVPGLLYRVPTLTVMLLSLLALPLTIGISILCYRLWDIDLIIRRTLVYSVLTTLLALIYFGSVGVLQNVFGALTGQRESTLVTVVSTLVIAALFVPLRRRVQAFIDRRFYRSHDLAYAKSRRGADPGRVRHRGARQSRLGQPYRAAGACRGGDDAAGAGLAVAKANRQPDEAMTARAVAGYALRNDPRTDREYAESKGSKHSALLLMT